MTLALLILFCVVILLAVGRTRRRDSDADFQEFERYLWKKNLDKGAK